MGPENAFHPSSQVTLLPVVQGPHCETQCSRAAVDMLWCPWSDRGWRVRIEALGPGPVQAAQVAGWLSGPPVEPQP